MKQYSLLPFPVTVLVLMIIACSCCCYSCCGCDGRPDHRRRKIQVRPAAHSWSATRADTTYHQGHTWTLWFSPMRMTFCTSSLKMATTILINMTQRTRNPRMEFLLSATASAELHGAIRKVMLLHHHCLPSSGRWVGMHGHTLLKNRHTFPMAALQLGQPRIPFVSRKTCSLRSHLQGTHSSAEDNKSWTFWSRHASWGSESSW